MLKIKREVFMKKLGFGGMRLPLNNPEDPRDFDFPQLFSMVDSFLEQGFTYLNTACMYHKYQS